MNEFGDAQTDSELAQENNVSIQEMINGCICCVLVGQMKLALLEMKEKYNPDRIVIETSGSAFPAPIAWQIRQLESEGFHLDAIVTVVDCENFTGYEDTSYTARMQAQYTDVILLNKHEQVSENKLDEVIDRVNDLNTDTVKVKCDQKQGVHPDLVFGLDTRLFQLSDAAGTVGEDCDKTGCDHSIGEDGLIDRRHHDRELDLIKIHDNDTTVGASPAPHMQIKAFEEYLGTLPKEEIYRVKGLARLRENGAETASLYIVNWAFGRSSLLRVTKTAEDAERRNIRFRLTVMGIDLNMYINKVVEGLHLSPAAVELHQRGSA